MTHVQNSRPVRRAVTTARGQPLVLQLTPEGIWLREPRRRTAYLLPYGHAFQTAVQLERIAHELTTELGPIPHVGLDAMQRPKVQTTRMIKCTCPECGYTVRTTAKWLQAATPVCPIHPETEMEVEQK